MSYDLLDRPTFVEVTPGPGVDGQTTFELFAYDGSSNLIMALDDDSTVQRAHDSIGGLIFETQNGRRTDVEVDGYGKTTGLTYLTGRLVDYIRDEDGRVQEIRDESDVIVELDYRGPVWVAERRYPLVEAESSFEQLGTGQLTASVHRIAGKEIDARSFATDGEGLREGLRESVRGGRGTWLHDSVGRTVRSRV
jgi:hypothetical protein